jgi:hypothetical protein
VIKLMEKMGYGSGFETKKIMRWWNWWDNFTRQAWVR